MFKSDKMLYQIVVDKYLLSAYIISLTHFFGVIL